MSPEPISPEIEELLKRLDQQHKQRKHYVLDFNALGKEESKRAPFKISIRVPTIGELNDAQLEAASFLAEEGDRLKQREDIDIELKYHVANIYTCFTLAKVIYDETGKHRPFSGQKLMTRANIHQIGALHTFYQSCVEKDIDSPSYRLVENDQVEKLARNLSTLAKVPSNSGESIPEQYLVMFNHNQLMDLAVKLSIMLTNEIDTRPASKVLKQPEEPIATVEDRYKTD